MCHSLVVFFQVFQTRLASFTEFISIFSGNSRSFSLSCNTEQRGNAVVKEQTHLFIDFILLCFIRVYFYCTEGCKYMVWSSNTMFLHIMLIIERYVFLPTTVLCNEDENLLSSLSNRCLKSGGEHVCNFFFFFFLVPHLFGKINFQMLSLFCLCLS